jgi:hypothetical protein
MISLGSSSGGVPKQTTDSERNCRASPASMLAITGPTANMKLPVLDHIPRAVVPPDSS